MSFEIVGYDSNYQKAVIDLWKQCDLIVPQNDPAVDIQRKLVFHCIGRWSGRWFYYGWL